MAFMTKLTNDLSWVSTKTVFLYWCGCCWELVCFYIFDGWWKLKSLLAAQAWKDHQVLLLWAQEPSAASIKKMQKNKKALQTIDTAKLSSTFIYFHSFPFLRKCLAGNVLFIDLSVNCHWGKSIDFRINFLLANSSILIEIFNLETVGCAWVQFILSPNVCFHYYGDGESSGLCTKV